MPESQPSLVIGIGARVEVELIDQNGQREPMAFDIVPSQYANLTRGLLSATAPLAQAIRGLRAGSEVAYVAGDIRRLRIVSVSRAKTADLEDVREQREEMLRKALNAAQRTDAEVFAASFSGKWGDYDMSDVPENT
ncbi:MAG: GreA/GreB family elongation factor [Caldilineales bacterium]